MRQEDILKEKYGTDPGFRVPEGYFEELNVRIMEQLPPYPAAPKPQKLTAWQRIKPYVYLAAMFAGIWVMRKVFHTVSSTESLSFDNPPAAIVQALESHPTAFETLYSTLPDLQLEEELSGDYQNLEDFERDFGYQLSPEYSEIEVSVSAQP